MRNEKLMEKSNEAWKLADEARVRQIDLGPASCMPVMRSRTQPFLAVYKMTLCQAVRNMP